MYRAGRLARVRTLEEIQSNQTLGTSTYWKDRATLAEKRIEELERSLVDQADRTEVAKGRIAELEQSLAARDRLLREAATTLRSVESEVFHSVVVESLALIEDVDGDPGSHMARVIRQIRGIFGGSEGPYSSSVQVQSKV